MTTYRPFLKARPGEIGAVTSSDHLGTRIQPVWELLPAETGTPTALLATALAALPHRVPWRIDARYLTTGRRSNISLVDDECRAAGVIYIPVVSTNALARDLAAAAAAATHHDSGIVVRLTAPLGAATTTDLRHSLATVRAAGLRPSQADLVIDCWYIPDQRSAALAAGALTVPLAYARTQGWRSITVLSGAIPEPLAGLPSGSPGVLPRHDADTFLQLAFTADFGDYAIAHPSRPATTEQECRPTICWNTGDDWVTCPDHTPEGAANSPTPKTSHDLCTNGHLGTTESTRRQQIAVGANGAISASGDPTDCYARATSHHLATVQQRLATGAA